MITNNTLKMDNFYKFKLRSVVPNAEEIYGKYTGKTSLESAQFFGEYSVHNQYVEEYGMALRDYFEYIRDDTELIIVHPLETLDPPTLNEKEPIYIPITLIDYQNSEDLLESNTFTFSITGIQRAFDTEDEKDSYSKSAISALNNILMREKWFTGENVTINISSTTKIKTRADIIRDKQIQADNIANVTAALVARTKLEEDQYREYYNKRKEYESALEKFQSDTAEIETMKENWMDKFKEIDKLNEIMDKKEARMEALYNEIKKYYDKAELSIPPYDQILSSIIVE